jgi:hypothetical protein
MSVEAFMENQNQTKATMLNVPQFDLSGKKTHVLNDVTSARYKWMVSPVDDSPTAKSRNMQDAILIINGSAGPLQKADPTGKLMAKFWSILDNPILNEAGRSLAKDVDLRMQSMSEAQKQKIKQEAQVAMIKAVADMERAKKAGVNLSFSGQDLSQYPNLMQLYQSLLQQSGMSQNDVLMNIENMNQEQPQQPMGPPPPAPNQQPQVAPPGDSGRGVPENAAPVAAAVS